MNTEYTVAGIDIIVLAVAVWFVGGLINRNIAFLERYSIPVAVTGGLLCSLIVTAIHYGFDVTINFDKQLRDICLLAFFSTIGLSAKLSLLKEGGKSLAILLVAAGVLLVREAGGTVTDVTGGDSSLDTGDIVAAGAEFHPALLAVTRDAFG